MAFSLKGLISAFKRKRASAEPIRAPEYKLSPSQRAKLDSLLAEDKRRHTMVAEHIGQKVKPVVKAAKPETDSVIEEELRRRKRFSPK